MIYSPCRYSDEQNSSDPINNSSFTPTIFHAGSFNNARSETLRSVRSTAVNLPPPRPALLGHSGRAYSKNTECKVKFQEPSSFRFLGSPTGQAIPEKVHVAPKPGSPKKNGNPQLVRGPVSLDRFIPQRHFSDPPSVPFHVTKVPQQLTPEEKLRRQCPPKEDPFMPSRPRRSPDILRTQMQAIHVQNAYHGSHLVNDQIAIGSHIGSRAAGSHRQVSSGSVWNVGGPSAVLGRPSTEITEASKRLTTAPMYVARFMDRPSVKDEREKHEARVALALNIDQTARLLGLSSPSPALDLKPNPSSLNYEQFCPFSWKDNAWKRAEKVQCKSNLALFIFLLPLSALPPFFFFFF